MNTQTHPLSRAALVFTCLAFLFLALLGRFIHLQVVRHAELKKKATKQRLRTRVTQAWRGSIIDRHGTPLAVATPVKIIYADLATWDERVDRLAPVVAPLLDLKSEEVARRVRRRLNQIKAESDLKTISGAALLKRNVPPDQWTTVRKAIANASFGLPIGRLSSKERRLLNRFRRSALFADDDQLRRYPYGTALAQVIGFVGHGSNGHLLQGKAGIEAAWNAGLTGRNGESVSSHDAAGNELAHTRKVMSGLIDGGNLRLTIDLNLQKIVETALAKAMATYSPSNAAFIVVRPQSGEILALANAPTFSPERPAASSPATWRNRVISDRNEAGSVFKVITLAAALDLGVTSLDDRVYCEDGRWIYNGISLRDGGRRYGHLSVRDCLAKSSNIGLAKIAVAIGPDRFYNYITNFGFNRTTGAPLPDEIPGLVRPPARWSGISATRLAIGHELAVSQISLAMAYAAIANEGTRMRPLLVRAVNHADGAEWTRYEPTPIGNVIRPDTAKQVLEAMQAVVDTGTGKAAALPDHTVAGKTGTAQKSDGRRYVPGRHYCSFIGITPVNQPEFVIAVAVDEPKGPASGGRVEAPVFREIAEQALALYGVPGDKTDEAPAAPRRRTSRPSKPLSPPMLARSQP